MSESSFEVVVHVTEVSRMDLLVGGKNRMVSFMRWSCLSLALAPWVRARAVNIEVPPPV
jgi:hypothetical protein